MHMMPGMSVLEAYISAKQMLTGDAGTGSVPSANAGLGEPATEAAEETECTVCDTLTTRKRTILHMRREVIEEGVEIEHKKKKSKYDQERMNQTRGTMEALHQAERAIEVQIKSHNKRKKIEKKEKKKRRKLEKKGAAAAMGTNTSSVSGTGGTRPMEPDQEPHRTESKKEEEVNDERAARRNKREAQKVKAEKADAAGRAQDKKTAANTAGPCPWCRSGDGPGSGQGSDTATGEEQAVTDLVAVEEQAVETMCTITGCTEEQCAEALATHSLGDRSRADIWNSAYDMLRLML